MRQTPFTGFGQVRDWCAALALPLAVLTSLALPSAASAQNSGDSANGNRTRLTFPDAAAFSYAYDGLNRMTGIYEGANQNTLRISVSYDSQGRRNGVNRAAGNTSAYAYDPASRLQTLTHGFVGGTGNLSLDFAYNPASQIKTGAAAMMPLVIV